MKLLFQQFSDNFSILPPPPPPPQLKKAKGYFQSPKSQREIISEQPLEAEKLEQEEAQRAAKLQAMKNMAEIESQRETVHQSMGASSKGRLKHGGNRSNHSNSDTEDSMYHNSDSDAGENARNAPFAATAKRRRTKRLRKDEMAKEQEKMRYKFHYLFPPLHFLIYVYFSCNGFILECYV
jgi:hypothetical protein